VFARMKASGSIPDSHTYCALLGACGAVSGRPDLADAESRKEVAQRVMAIQKDMAQSGVRTSHSCICFCIGVVEGLNVNITVHALIEKRTCVLNLTIDKLIDLPLHYMKSDSRVYMLCVFCR